MERTSGEELPAVPMEITTTQISGRLPPSPLPYSLNSEPSEAGYFHYNSILTNTDAQWEKTHEASVLGAAERYGYDRRMFHDCRQALDAAVESLAKAVNESTAENPLYFIVAVPCRFQRWRF